MARFALICLIMVVSTRSTAQSRILRSDEESKPMKKGYTYVSEYKRLPVFNFGIGKRWVDNNGLRGAQPYSFGFGKRSIQHPSSIGKKDTMEPYETYINSEVQQPREETNKRGERPRAYDFGIGKRSLPFVYENIAADREAMANADLKHNLNDEFEQRLLYDLSKKFALETNDDRDDD